MLQIVDSSHGLLTTVAYQLGAHASPVYALEGSVAIAGAVIEWLKDNLEINNVKGCETVVDQMPAENNVVFVPAFAGLYAPYWRKDARRLGAFFLSIYLKIKISHCFPEWHISVLYK